MESLEQKVLTMYLVDNNGPKHTRVLKPSSGDT